MPTASQPNVYMLRWAFEYSNRPRKAGMWGMATKNPVDSAWAQPKDGLIYALIEGKDIKTRLTHRLVECPGADFRTFQWVATAALPGMGLKGAVTLRSKLVGLKILSRDICLEVHSDGKLLKRALTDGERSIQFAAY